MGDAVTRLHDEYRDDKEHVPADKPHGNDSKQRWWVDHLHRVQSGTLIDLSGTQAVVRGNDGFAIKHLNELYRSYTEALASAANKLSKIQQETSEKMTAVMVELSKHAKKKA